MRGKRTCIVLGAGASYCYEDGHANVPTQQDMIGRLFYGADTSSGEGFPSFSAHSGLVHSFELGQYLRKRYELPEEGNVTNAKLDFWQKLQKRGYNLESLYTELDKELSPDRRHLLNEFQSIIRTAVKAPAGDRKRESICRYHRQICARLEPGDYIVNFNWDSLMADALLEHSHFWFPMSGFGFPGYALLPESQKALPVESLVHLFQVHGSVLLFEPESGERKLLYVGPEQWEPMSGLLQQYGVDPRDRKGKVSTLPGDEETHYKLFQLGYVIIEGSWFRPLFIPPSPNKPEYSHWYFRSAKGHIHQRLPTTRRIVIAGYSFPDADIEHLTSMFVPAVLHPELEIHVVNKSNDQPAFRSRISSLFGSRVINYSVSDFKLLDGLFSML